MGDSAETRGKIPGDTLATCELASGAPRESSRPLDAQWSDDRRDTPGRSPSGPDSSCFDGHPIRRSRGCGDSGRWAADPAPASPPLATASRRRAPGDAPPIPPE